ncbi:hypothetical protein H1C71_041757 [Ictidomys tridecemlineatus]|nr:hypothetical protein H1C71_041757 [Ictidomys tridecemlineatus]
MATWPHTGTRGPGSHPCRCSSSHVSSQPGAWLLIGLWLPENPASRSWLSADGPVAGGPETAASSLISSVPVVQFAFSVGAGFLAGSCCLILQYKTHKVRRDEVLGRKGPPAPTQGH